MNLQNLVDYCKLNDLPDVFSGADLPEPLNVETCVSAIMVRCGLLTPVYTDPDTFRSATSLWFTRKQWTFEHLINVINAKYSPIENVDETREEKTTYDSKDTHTGGYSDAASGSDTVADSGSDSVEESGTDERDISNSGTDTTTNTISAFNSSTYQPDNQTETAHGHAIDDDITYGKSTETTYGKSTETTYGKSISHTYNNDQMAKSGSDTLRVRRHGNIGVTSNVKLIEEELSLLRHFDIYGYIAELFEEENMLMIY